MHQRRHQEGDPRGAHLLQLPHGGRNDVRPHADRQEGLRVSELDDTAAGTRGHRGRRLRGRRQHHVQHRARGDRLQRRRDRARPQREHREWRPEPEARGGSGGSGRLSAGSDLDVHRPTGVRQRVVPLRAERVRDETLDITEQGAGNLGPETSSRPSTRTPRPLAVQLDPDAQEMESLHHVQCGATSRSPGPSTWSPRSARRHRRAATSCTSSSPSTGVEYLHISCTGEREYEDGSGVTRHHDGERNGHAAGMTGQRSRSMTSSRMSSSS